MKKEPFGYCKVGGWRGFGKSLVKAFSSLTRVHEFGKLPSMFRVLAQCILLLSLAVSYAEDSVPDFKLQDVSLSSPRRGAVVSPRDYVMQVSGYYFGEAT